MLYLTINSEDEHIQIGPDVHLYFKKGYRDKYFRRMRIGILAPPHVEIVRDSAINKNPRPRD